MQNFDFSIFKYLTCEYLNLNNKSGGWGVARDNESLIEIKLSLKGVLTMFYANTFYKFWICDTTSGCKYSHE